VGEVEFGGDAVGPLGGAQGAIALDGEVDGGFVGGALGSVDEGEPAGVAGEGVGGPGGEEGLLFGGAVEAAVEAGPGPGVGAGDEFGAEGVSFDVAADAAEGVGGSDPAAPLWPGSPGRGGRGVWMGKALKRPW